MIEEEIQKRKEALKEETRKRKEEARQVRNTVKMCKGNTRILRIQFPGLILCPIYFIKQLC